jgi:Rod binding domain-containing protein
MSLAWGMGSIAERGQASCTVPGKVARAAHQFEAVLLNSLLGSLEKTVGKAPGGSGEDSGTDYTYMGTQALASVLGDQGALGVATMITKKLAQCR